jgi:hypothetical protein
MTDSIKAGRLALREEGDFWNAYYAPPDTLHGALLLGSIRMQLICEHPRRKAMFMALIRDAVGDAIKHVTGDRPEWPDPEGEPAPERERSGNA